MSTFSVQVTDAAANTATATLVIEISEPPRPPSPPPQPLVREPALRLVLDDGREMTLDGLDSLLHVTEVDWGFPEVREVADNYPQAHGAIDRTEWFGSRVVTITGKLAIDWPSNRNFGPRNSTLGGRRHAIMDELAPFLDPGARPWLHDRFDDGVERRMRVRVDQMSSPQIANVRDFSLSFKSPTGVLEDVEERRVVLVPEFQVDGRTYWRDSAGNMVSHDTPGAIPDRVYDRIYPHGSGNAYIVRNEGSSPANWQARIFGPCSGPAIVNVSTEEEVSVPGLTLLANQFVLIDVREHTVTLDGLPEASRWSAVDFAATTWWQLPPGESWLRLRTDAWSDPCQMIFTWRNTHLVA